MVPVRDHLFRFSPLIGSLLAVATFASATETDQFTTPGAPLQDIGPALSRKVVEVIEADRSGRDPERVLYDWAGHNLFESRPARYAKEIQAGERPVQFRPSVSGSIYRGVFSPVPASFLFDSPTVRLHGYYLGTDKIDHFFREGRQYYDLVTKKVAEGSGLAEAIAAAVAHGVKLEHRQLGTLSSGVFSNGDLAANYAGMKFYLNLREPVRIGGRVWPALFQRSADGWRLRAGVDPDRVLEPFLSNHLDESLNPSRYRFSRGSIRALIRDRCDQWAPFYADRRGLVAPSGQSFASSWFGEDYGHWLPPVDEVSIATECAAAIR